MRAAIPLKVTVLAFDIGTHKIKLHLEKAKQPKTKGRWDDLPRADAGRLENNVMIHRAAQMASSVQGIPASNFTSKISVIPLVKKPRWHKDQLATRRGECSHGTTLFKVLVKIFIGGSVTPLADVNVPSYPRVAEQICK